MIGVEAGQQNGKRTGVQVESHMGVFLAFSAVVMRPALGSAKRERKLLDGFSFGA